MNEMKDLITLETKYAELEAQLETVNEKELIPLLEELSEIKSAIDSILKE